MTAAAGTAGSIGRGALVPLLDALFLLLFALLSLSESAGPAMREVAVQLPAVEPDPGAAPSPRAPITIAVDAGSRVLWAATGETLSTAADLDARLAAQLGDALPDEIPVELRADRDARHGVAVALLEHLRRRGFVDVRLLATGDADVATLFDAGGAR